MSECRAFLNITFFYVSEGRHEERFGRFWDAEAAMLSKERAIKSSKRYSHRISNSSRIVSVLTIV